MGFGKQTRTKWLTAREMRNGEKKDGMITEFKSVEAKSGDSHVCAVFVNHEGEWYIPEWAVNSAPEKADLLNRQVSVTGGRAGLSVQVSEEVVE